MEMTRGGINGIVTGPTVPSAGAVKLLEMLAMEDGGKVVPAPGAPKSATETQELACKLQEIRDSDLKTFNVARTMIDSLHAQLDFRKRPSSVKVQATADAHTAAAIHKVRSRRKPAA